MPDTLGYESIVVMGLGSTWGTPVVGTQCLTMMNFDDSGVNYELIEDGTLKGFGDQRTPDQGPLVVALSGETRLRYTTGNLLLRAFFGALSGGTYTLLDSLTGVFLTMAALKGGGASPHIVEYDSVKVNELTLSGNPGDGTMLSWSGIGAGFDLASSTNTEAIILALANTLDANIQYTDWNFRVGDLADALGSGDAVELGEFEFTWSRPMAEDHVNSSREIIEPVDDGFKELTLSCILPRFFSTQFLTWRNARTRLQGRWHASGAGQTKTILIPNMVISSYDNSIPGAEHIPQEIELVIRAGVDSITDTDISASTTDDSFNAVGNDFPLVFPGATLWVSGFSNATNNGRHTVVSGTVSKIIVTTNLTNEAAGNSVTIRSQNPALVLLET